MSVKSIIVCANGAGLLANRLALALCVAGSSHASIQVLAFRSARLPHQPGLLPFGQEGMPDAESRAWDTETGFLEHSKAIYDELLGPCDHAGGAVVAVGQTVQSRWIVVEQAVETAFASYARACDLIVAGSDPDDGAVSTLDDAVSRIALLESGRLVLFVGRAGQEPADLLVRVIIAWDDGPAAARAIAQAAPLIAAAACVCVLVVETDAGRVTPCNQILAYLRQLAPNTIVKAVSSVAHTVGHTLLAEAAAWNASLIIMGAYDHSRGREIVFGGTTRFVIGHAGCPVLTAK